MLSLATSAKQFADAHEQALKAIQADRSDKFAYYMAGFVDWAMTWPDYVSARQAAGMQQQTFEELAQNGHGVERAAAPFALQASATPIVAAVRNWVFQPTVVNGEPVEITTMLNLRILPLPAVQ
jgi:hypothetical protein